MQLFLWCVYTNRIHRYASKGPLSIRQPIGSATDLARLLSTGDEHARYGHAWRYFSPTHVALQQWI